MDINNLKSTINQNDLIVTEYNIQKRADYAFLSISHEIFTKLDNTPGHKNTLTN